MDINYSLLLSIFYVKTRNCPVNKKFGERIEDESGKLNFKGLTQKCIRKIIIFTY